MHVRGRTSEDFGGMMIAGRKRALAVALLIAVFGFAQPVVAQTSSATDNTATDNTPKKRTSWRDEFPSAFMRSPSKASTSAAGQHAPAKAGTGTAAADIAATAHVAAVDSAATIPVSSSAQPAPSQTTVVSAPSSTPRAAPVEKVAQTAVATTSSQPSENWATDASKPVRSKREHPVYAPPAERQEVATTRAAASTPNKAGAQAVAASVFDQWLDDKPADEAAHGGVSSMTEAQLRQHLYEAVLVASERSPQIMQAKAQWEATRYDVAYARGKRLPQVQLSAQSATKNIGGREQLDNAYDDSTYDAAVSLNITTPVYDWGSAKKTEQSNKQLATAAEQGYHATLESTAIDVSNTLLELGRYRSMTAIGDAYVKRMRALVDMLAQISAADQGRRSEWVQARAQLLQAQTNRDASAAQARQLEIKLQILLGDNYHVDLPDGGIWPIKPVDVDALLAQFQDHPAIRQARATADAADLSASAQRASKLPRLDWVVSKTAFHNAQPGLEQPWGTSLQVSWPLFSGGSDSAAYSAALARADASRQQVDVLKRNYEYQVRDTAQAATDAFARANEYGDLSNETLKVRKAMFEQWYQLGKRSLLDVLTSETDHYNDMVGEVSNRFDAYEAVFSAYDGAGKLVDWLSNGSSRQ